MSLTDEQQRVVRLVLEERRNVFLTGGAGTGKSFVVQNLLDLAPRHTTFVTASTGVAAVNIGGTTVHSFSGLRPSNTDRPDDSATLIRNAQCNHRARQRWARCELLIVDEISMLDADTLGALDTLGRSLVPDGAHRPFGGVQLLLVGDFLQLPPVTRKRRSDGSRAYNFAFQSPAWRALNLCVVRLQNSFRQSADDTDFLRILGTVRLGRLTPEGRARLDDCVVRPTDGAVAPTTRLCGINREVDTENRRQLEALDGTMRVLHAMDACTDLPEGAAALQQLQNNCPAHAELQLKIGAYVVLLTNLDVEGGLVNGTKGTVVAFETTETVVVGGVDEATKQLRKVTVTEIGPVVSFCIPGGRQRQVCLHRNEWCVSQPWREAEPPFPYDPAILTKPFEELEPAQRGDLQRLVQWRQFQQERSKLARRWQFPLRLCWAISVHKSQGMTLDNVEIAMRGIFEYGQFYVALSRARSLDGVRLCELLPDRIRAHPEVVRFYAQLDEEEERQQTEADTTKECKAVTD